MLGTPDSLTVPAAIPVEQPEPSSRLGRMLALDFTRPAAAVGLGAVYLLSRLPWLGLSYGTDPDAARVAISARWLWDHGEIYPSRLPGYPLFELVAAALYPLGATAINSATLLVSFAGVLLFAAILKRLDVPLKGLLTVSYAFAPMTWINSSITLDYLWGITFILAAYLAILSHRFRLGGLMLGIAIGCRPTSAMMALPFFILLVRERRLRPLVEFYGVMVLTALLAFLPITLRYGLAFLNFFDVRPTWHRFARTLGVEAFGLTSLLGFLVVAALSWRRFLELPHRLRRDPHLAVAVLAMLLVFMSFMRLPLEEAYLAPAIPFLLLGAARLLRRWAVAVICLLLVMGGLVDFHTVSTEGWSRPGAAIAGIRPQPGRVLIDRELRVQRLKIARGMRNLELPPNSVITAGFYYPIVVAEYPEDFTVTLPKGFRKKLIGPLTDGSEARNERDIIFVWLMTPADARRYRFLGYRTYTMDLDGTDVLTTFETYLPEHERFAVR